MARSRGAQHRVYRPRAECALRMSPGHGRIPGWVACSPRARGRLSCGSRSPRNSCYRELSFAGADDSSAAGARAMRDGHV